MRVLIACEFSGAVRDAFLQRGHDAWSCDILPTESPGPHIQRDVLAILDQNWDLLIAHPPCTYLSYAGIAFFNESKYGEKARERKVHRDLALQFFMSFLNAPISKIAVENPRGYVNTVIRPCDQMIQPYFWGDPHVKSTCLWLKNLPKLTHKACVKPEPLRRHLRKPGIWYKGGENKNRYFIDVATRDPHIRSKTFPGIANAMAEQWG